MVGLIDKAAVAPIAQVEVDRAVVGKRIAAAIHAAEQHVSAPVAVDIAGGNRQADLALQPEAAEQHEQTVLIEIRRINCELNGAALRRGAKYALRQQQREDDGNDCAAAKRYGFRHSSP